VLQLRQARRTRETQLMSELSRQLDEPAIVESRKALTTDRDRIRTLVEAYYVKQEALRGEDLDLFVRAHALPNFLEVVGALVRHAQGIRLDLIDDFWGSWILKFWERWQPLAEIERAHLSKTAYTELEYLVGEIQQRRTLIEAKRTRAERWAARAKRLR